jgi:transcriptional regulator with XRE-family HTH domain
MGGTIMNENMFQQVGNNIQAILQEKNKTQQYLADRLNISKQVMSKIIMGAKAINVFEISQIASVLEVSVEKLLDVKQDPISHNFSFMGRVENERTKEKIELLKTIIDEIILLEEYSGGEYEIRQ